MRCPKCSYITFDYLAACPHCQTDLTSIRRALGNLLPLVGEADFLSDGRESPVPQEASEEIKASPAPQEEVSSAGLSDIDVSDLVGAEGDEEVFEELEKVDISALESEDFKKALDEILKEKS